MPLGATSDTGSWLQWPVLSVEVAGVNSCGCGRSWLGDATAVSDSDRSLVAPVELRWDSASAGRRSVEEFKLAVRP